MILPERFLALLGCEDCGVVQSTPVPSAEALDAWYTEPYGWETRSRDDEEKLIRRAKKKEERYAERLELLRVHLRPVGTGGPPTVFDFGCGLGSWLDVLQSVGWETSGLEPGPKQARVAARRHRMLDSIPADGRFDLVIANHVLEHLLDPLATVREIAGALAPGGQIFVSVPDFGRVHVHRDLPYVASDVHMNSFTFSGMRSLLALAGFEVEEQLEGAEWDTLSKKVPPALRVLARKSDRAPFPVEETPLDQAVDALRELGRIESREETDQWVASRTASRSGTVADAEAADAERAGAEPTATMANGQRARAAYADGEATSRPSSALGRFLARRR